MKNLKFFTAIFMAFSLAACQNDNGYVIDGSVYGGRNFEDQTIYLAPLAAASVQANSDSAVIHDGRFRFEGYAKEDGVYVLRMRPMMKLFIGEPFVIIEPGHIRVRLNQVSTVGGTPQNDSLQAWNDFKARNDSALTEIKRQIKRATPDEVSSLVVMQDSLKAVFEKKSRETVSVNSNAFGEFVDKWYVR